MHARALVEGRAYTDIGFIHSRFTTLIAPVAEPPGLPLLIAGMFSVVGESLAWVRALLVLSFVAFALVLWHYWRRLESETVAVIITAWTVVALLRLHVVDTVLADLPCAAALWLTFLIIDSPRAALERRHYVGLAAAGALAFSFRMAALPLLPAMACLVLLRPATERRGLLLGGAVWVLSAVAVLFLLPGAESLSSEVARTPSDIARDVAVNVRTILDGARDWIPLALPWRPATIALHGVILIVAAWGALVALREQPRRFAYITAAWYVVMLIVLPTRAERYMWPLYPLLVFAFIRGLRAIVAAILPGTRHATLGFAAMAMLIVGMLQDATAARPRALHDDAEARAIVETLRREARVRPVRAAFFSPRVLTWETGVTTTAFGDAAPEAIYDEVRRAGLTHVVIGDAGTSALGHDATALMIMRHRSSFVPLLTNKSFTIYEVRGSPGER
ncbi:MAG: glycosyltransferase family 39 protein [Gemmatimonadaceae bacterium]